MSEEEKKAIEYIEQFIGIEKQYKYKPIKIKTLTNTRPAIQTILNLIEKQQKEIEELKKPKYIMNFDTGEITKIDTEFISKDKIREKLDYQFMLWNTPNRQKEYSQDVVEILEELLEE